MSSESITPRLVFLSFSFSIASGLCFLNSGHILLQSLGVPAFTTLPSYTSIRIGLVGGAFTALPILTMRTVPSKLSDILQCSYVTSLFLAIVALGAAQGYFGAKLWGGQNHVTGRKLPGVLGVGCASLAGAVGALVLVGCAVGFLVAVIFVLEHFFPKERRNPRRRTRPHGPTQLVPVEAEQHQRHTE